MKRPVRDAIFANAALGCALLQAGAGNAGTGNLEGVRTVPLPAARTVDESMAMGRLMLSNNNPREALGHFRAVVSADPSSVDALNGMAVAYDKLGRPDVSRNFYEAALGLAPNDPVLLYNYGYSLYRQGDFAAASRHLLRAAAGDDPDAQARSLALLAKVERAAPPALPAAEPAPSGQARIIRTSGHEVRLMLGGSASPAPELRAELGDAALATVAVAALTPVEEARIEAREAALELAEARAAQAATARLAAVAARHPPSQDIAPLPAAMSAVMAALAAPPELRVPDGFRGFGPTRAPPPDEGMPWILERRTVPAGPQDAEAPGLRVARLAPALIGQRKAAPARLAERTVAALPPAPRRAFDSPFQSDDARLNGFAQRVQGSADADVEQQVARLQALLDHLGAA